MSLFHLRSRVGPAVPLLTPSRVAEPDTPWDIPPPHGPTDPPAVNGQRQAYPRYSQRLIDAADRTLEPADAAQRTQQALREAARALSGVDYLTQLAFSAVHQGAGFKEVAQGLGRSPHGLDPATRAQIDARMDQRFAQAAAKGEAPVDRHTAAQWLHHELFILTY